MAMNLKKILSISLCISFIVLTSLSCAKITVRAHADVKDLKFGNESVGTMYQDEEKEVEIQKSITTTVTWKSYDSGDDLWVSESDYIYPYEADSGQVWHLYKSYITTN